MLKNIRIMEEAIYYLHINGEQRGPFTLHELPAQGASMETMVWRAGLPNWVPAAEVPEVASIIQEQQMAAPQYPGYTQQPYGPQPPYSPQQPYGPQPDPYFQPRQQYAQYGGYPAGWVNWMTWAIVATIIAVILCGLLNTVFGVIGIVKANSANDAARRGDPAAEQMNSSAKTWTIVSLVLSGLGLLLVIFVFAAGGY